MNPLLFLAFAGTVAATSITLKDCGSGAAFKINSLDFSPSAPVPGQNGTLHTVYNVPAEVAAGTVKYSCSLNGLPVYSENFDLCSQTACPVSAGTHDDYSTSQVPNTNGKVSCTIDWRDTAGKQLLCIQMIMNLAAKLGSLRGAWVPHNHGSWHPKHLFGTNLSLNATCPIPEPFNLERPVFGPVWEPFSPPAEKLNSTATPSKALVSLP